MKKAKLFTFKNYFAIATVDKENHVFVTWFSFDDGAKEIDHWDTSIIELSVLYQFILEWADKKDYTLWKY